MTNKKGFTLIELLIVIGILAILATITVLVLNPAQLFAQARDSQRLSDLGSLKGAISLYLTSYSSPVLQGGTGFACGTNFGSSFATAGTSWFTDTATQVEANMAHAGDSDIDGTGWVAVNLGDTTGGSPLPTLPSDPKNDTSYNYQYSCDQTNKTFELNANLESARYTSGDDNLEDSDGGDVTTIYETGTDPGLDL